MGMKSARTLNFATIYPLYIKKVERKGRTKEQLDEVIGWLTGYDEAGIRNQVDRGNDFETFFAEAPRINPNSAQISGVICGYRVEEIEHPVEQKCRQLDKLVDELANGKAMKKIKRE